MNRKHWTILAVTLVLMAALILPACAQTTTAPAPAPAPTTAPAPAPTTAPAPKPTTAPAPAPTTAPAPVVGGPTADAPWTIKISYSCPKNKGYSTGPEYFATEFPKRTNGRYKVETYAASTLVPITAVLDSTRKGVVEIGLTSTAQFAKDFPLSMITQMPTYGWQPPGSTETPEILAAASVAWDQFEKIPEVANEFKDFIYMSNSVLPASNVVMKSKQIHVPADFKGTRIGGVGALGEIVKANGGAAVAIVTPDIYMNMDKGVIDGALLSMTMTTDWKIETIANYFFMQDVGSGNMVTLTNKDFWNKMPKADQDLAWKVWQEGQTENQKFMANSAIASRQQLISEGKTLTAPTASDQAAWARGIEPALRGWRDDAISVGVSTAALDKVQQAWLDIRAQVKKQFNLQ